MPIDFPIDALDLTSVRPAPIADRGMRLTQPLIRPHVNRRRSQPGRRRHAGNPFHVLESLNQPRPGVDPLMPVDRDALAVRFDAGSLDENSGFSK